MIVCLGLESTVKQSIYLPNTPWVIQYNSPPVCSRGTKLIDLNIERIDEEQVTFPFTVYGVKFVAMPVFPASSGSISSAATSPSPMETAPVNTSAEQVSVLGQLGVYQGDPLSVIIFNTVMNTLVDSITQPFSQLGYNLSSVGNKINLLQYADDTSLIGDGPSSCQHLSRLTESWLAWSGMRANVPKCVCIAVKASCTQTSSS